MTERGRSFPSFALMHEGRLSQHGAPLMLERREGDEWTEIARYGTAAEAAEGLDEQLAKGTTQADHLRLSPITRRRLRLRKSGLRAESP